MITTITGWSTAQATPSAACLYRTRTSRQARKNSSCRYFQTAPSSRSNRPRSGRISNRCEIRPGLSVTSDTSPFLLSLPRPGSPAGARVGDHGGQSVDYLVLLLLAHLGVQGQQDDSTLRTLALGKAAPGAPRLLPVRRLEVRTHDAAPRRDVAVEQRLHDAALFKPVVEANRIALPVRPRPLGLDRRRHAGN